MQNRNLISLIAVAVVIVFVLGINWFFNIDTASIFNTKTTRRNLEINGFNYTDFYIDGFTVNGQGGGNVFVSTPTSGGGGGVCCIRWDDSITPPMTVTVEWTHDNVTVCRQEVRIQEPFPAEPNHLGIHFFQDGHVEAAVTEEYPELKLELESVNEAERKASGNVMPPCPSSR